MILRRGQGTVSTDRGSKHPPVHLLRRLELLKNNRNLAYVQKCTRLLQDADVRRWYENLCRGSKLTASVRLRRLNLFCIQHKTSPKELVSIGKEDARKLEDLLHDHVTELESKKYAPSSISSSHESTCYY